MARPRSIKDVSWLGIITASMSTMAFVCLLFVPNLADASSNYASFASFYEKTWSPMWILIIGLAIAAGIAVTLIAPPVGAAASAVGSTIGGMAGFHGIAATNFGLALLGGGAMSSGGLGIAGGMGVLASALVFTTGVATDYAAYQIRENSRFESFVDESKNFLTLPPPRSTDGQRSYRGAMKLLVKLDQEKSVMAPENQSIISESISIMESRREGAKARDGVRDDTMLALLYFMSHDYDKARSYAQRAVYNGKAQNLVVSLPEYILAVCLLYEREVDFPQVVEHFNNSFRAEPSNSQAGLMYAIVLDRIHFRMNEGSLVASDLNMLTLSMDSGVLGEHGLPAFTVVLSRYLLRLFDAQQRIENGVSLEKESDRYSAKSIRQVQDALAEYHSLVEGGRFITGGISVLTIKAPRRMAELVNQAEILGVELKKYADDLPRLAGMANALENEQLSYIAKQSGPTGKAVAERETVPFGTPQLVWWLFVFTAVSVAGVVAYKNMRGRK